MSQRNILNRYLFDNAHARGELVQLSSSYQDIIKNHHYPKVVEKVLGELLAATCLLTATLKFEGEITVQLQGNGPISYMSVNGDNNQQMRGIAKINDTILANEAVTLKALMGKGTMIITIRPNQGEPYQGIVALDGETLADCMSHYFDVSAQIPTKVWLFHDHQQQQVAGTLIQLLPDGDGGQSNQEKQQDDFQHLCQLTNTVKAEEIFTLEAEALLYRLYHNEQVKLFEPQPVTYLCGCSADKCLSAIAQIEPSEIRSILVEQGKISMTCEYCITTYDFDELSLKSFVSKVNH